MSKRKEENFSDLQLKELNSKLEFYESIIDKLPAHVYINEVDESGDPSLIKSIWANKRALDFIGYSQEEISKMGNGFLVKTIHPDDLNSIPLSYKCTDGLEKENITAGLYRQRGKDQTDYKWFYNVGLNYAGSSKQLLCFAIEVINDINHESKLISLLREVSLLKNKLRFDKLTKREREILELIANGNTDKEISKILSISIATAKTHRNKMIKKLELKNTAALVAFAKECGL